MICVNYHQESGWAIIRHKGIHKYPWPQAKKPDLIEKEALKKQVAMNPKAGAFQLKVMSICCF
jgi:hypothetical protein